MSQHQFVATIQEQYPSAGKAAQVLCGWDKPLQYCFLLVELGEGAAATTLYDSLTELGGGLSLAQVERRAAATGIALPAGLLARLQAEMQRNAGNCITKWTEQGPEIIREE